MLTGAGTTSIYMRTLEVRLEKIIMPGKKNLKGFILRAQFEPPGVTFLHFLAFITCMCIPFYTSEKRKRNPKEDF